MSLQQQEQQEEVKTSTTTTTTTPNPSTPSGRYFCPKCNWSGAKINHAGVCLSCQMNGVKVVLRWQCNNCPKSILWNGKSNHERSASHISIVANPTQKVGPIRKKSISHSKTSSHLSSQLPPPLTTPPSPSSSSSSSSSPPVDLSQVTFCQVPTTIHQPPPYQCSLPQTTSLLDELFMEDFLNTFELEPQPFILDTNINLTSSSETTPTLTSPGSPVSIQSEPSVFNTSEFATTDLSLEQSTLEILNTEISNLESRLRTLQYHRQRLLRLRNATQSVGSEPIVVATSTNTITPAANQTTTSVPSMEFKLSVSNNTFEPSCYNEYDNSNRYTTPLPIEFATPSTLSFEFNSPVSDIIELIEFKSPSTPIEFATPRLDYAESGIASSIEFGHSLLGACIDDELSYGLYEFRNSDSRDYEESNNLNLSCDPLGFTEPPSTEARGLCDGKGEGELREFKGTRSLAIGCRELCGVNNSPLECKAKDNSNNSLPLLTSLDSDSRAGIRQYKNTLDEFRENSTIYSKSKSNHNNYIYINNIINNNISSHTIEFERTSLLTAVAA